MVTLDHFLYPPFESVHQNFACIIVKGSTIIVLPFTMVPVTFVHLSKPYAPFVVV